MFPTNTAESQQVRDKGVPNKKGKWKPRKHVILNSAEFIVNDTNHPARLAGKSVKSPGRWATSAD